MLLSTVVLEPSETRVTAAEVRAAARAVECGFSSRPEGFAAARSLPGSAASSGATDGLSSSDDMNEIGVEAGAASADLAVLAPPATAAAVPAEPEAALGILLAIR